MILFGVVCWWRREHDDIVTQRNACIVRRCRVCGRTSYREIVTTPEPDPPRPGDLWWDFASGRTSKWDGDGGWIRLD